MGVTKRTRESAARPRTDNGKRYDLRKRRLALGTPGKGRPGLVVQKSKIRRSLKTQRQGCPCLLTPAPLHSLVYAPPGTRCVICTPRVLPEESFLYTPKPCPKGVLTNTSSPSLLSAPRENPRPLAGVRVGRTLGYCGTQDKDFSYQLFLESCEDFHWL